jgi:pre-mRNA cleavage complex 2 protein Pcf11
MNEEEEEIDEEQIEDYCSMLDRLGNFPEKVVINSLSMAAEDFASSRSSAMKIYNCILERLVDTNTPGVSYSDRKLPLVYVLDSLLKNVKGVFIDIIQGDAVNWMTTVFDIFDRAGKVDEKARLRKVWNTWREQGIIKDVDRWREIGKCFLEAEERAKAASSDARIAGGGGGGGGTAGISRNADGTLQIPPMLRKQMQLLLDEVQSTGVDELDKVSLERLADINPDLLKQIMEAAMEEQEQQQQQQQQRQSSSILSKPLATAVATPVCPISDWSRLKVNHIDKAHDLISSLQKHVRSANEMTIVASDMDDVVHLYASVSASAQILTDMLRQMKDGTGLLGYIGAGGTGKGGGDVRSSRTRLRRSYYLIKRENFTTEGVRKRNDGVIAQLYEVGLPFVCSADGRRFGTQLELSRHLDALFRSSQLEKTMDRTDERGWYADVVVWSTGGGGNATNASSSSAAEKSSAANIAGGMSSGNGSTESTTVVADETRDRCVLCGINFAMFFDQDDGEWKYRNCKEMNVDEDDGPTLDDEEVEPVLVHVTCWDGLGCPNVLTPDQIRHR